ncbi:hypothetical protein AgCh_033518 [Apium graveolens]
MLQQKHVPVVACCPVCDGENESIIHSLVSFLVAAQCWHKAFPELSSVVATDFFSWRGQALSKLDAWKRAEAVTLRWTVWKARNEKVWNQRKARIDDVVSSAAQYLKQWKEGQGRSNIFLSQPFLAGMVARNSSGHLIQAKAKLFQEMITPALAEAMAIKEALSWTKQEQWKKVVIESDSLVAIQAIRGQVPMRSLLGKVVEDCRNLVKGASTTSLFFVKRYANEAAHYIARESYSFRDRVLVGSSVPVEFMFILQADLAH